jgi:hypothetical protein
MDWVVICLGNEPRVYGLFHSELSADDWVEDVHCTPSIDIPEGLCSNNINGDEHHVLQILHAGMEG